MNERKWMACAFVRFKVPELHLHPREWTLLRTDPVSKAQARDEMRDMIATVESPGWLFWIEPENMTEAEREKYVPLDVHNATAAKLDT